MRDRRANRIIVGALLLIAAALVVYAALALRWLAGPARPRASAARADRAAAGAALAAARKAFRADLLDVRAHVRLSEALWRAGRPVDSFYVLHAARRLFARDEFRRAHAELVLGAGGPAAEERERLLRGVTDRALSVPRHADVARDYPDSPEGRDALEQLSRLASGDENAPGGDAARLALIKLKELAAEAPRDPERLVALAKAYLGRGNDAQAQALAAESLNKHPDQPGAARVMAMLALKNRDADAALPWLTEAWERDPGDLYSAARLAQIYDKRRGDPASALPFYLALYRSDPDYEDGKPAELRIREILDARREDLLRGVPVEGLGGRLRLDDASLRVEACARAAAFKDPRWIDALGELLDDDVELVRQGADYALFQIGRAQPLALRARRDAWLESPKPLVRIRALNLFADLDGFDAFPLALKALEDPEPAVRAYAKVMVLDHYYAGRPEARSAARLYLSRERDPRALAFERRLTQAQ